MICKTLLGLILFLLLFSLSSVVRSQTSILFWHYYPDERGEAIEALMEEFNQTHEVQVTVQFFPGYDQQHDAILSGLVNGSTPNVILAYNYHAALYQMSGALVDLTPSVEASSLQGSDFYPLIWAQDVWNGQRLGLPLSRAYEALYINMDALRELGYEAPPQTRAELGSMACAFKGWHGYEGVEALGYDLPLNASFLISLSQPALIYHDEAFHLNSLSPGLQFLLAQIQGRCTNLNQGAQNRFAAGRTLFLMESSAAQPYIERAIGDFFAEPFEVAVVPMPAENAPVLNLSGSSLSIIHHDEFQDAAAWELLEWLAQPEQVTRWAAATSTLPARRDVPAPAFDSADWIAEPNLPGYDLVRDEIVFTAQAILSGEDLNTRLSALDAQANIILEAFQ